MGKARASKTRINKTDKGNDRVCTPKNAHKFSKNYARICREDAMSPKDGMNFDE